MILFINGSPNKDGNTARLARELIGDRPYEQLNLAEHKVYGYGQSYGDDDFEDVLARIEAADTLVVGSPVYWHSLSGMTYGGMVDNTHEARALSKKLA